MRRVGLLKFCLLGGALVAASSASAAPRRPGASPPRVQNTNYLTWEKSLVMTGSALQAVLVPKAGGRILEYSLNGENVLLPQHPVTGQAAGYQCDVGPRQRALPPHERLWMGTYDTRLLNDVGLRLRSEPDPQLGLELEKEVFMDPESGDLGLTQRMRNVSKQEASYCLWDRTVCKDGGFVVLRLKKRSLFPAKWALLRNVGGKESYDGAKPQSPQVRVDRGILVAKCEGTPIQFGADSDAGWIAYIRDRWLFIKYFPYLSKGRYTDNGNSVTVAYDGKVVELGPLSPEIKLKPGESYDFPEKWSVIELDSRVSTFEEAQAIVNKIPESPFE